MNFEQKVILFSNYLVDTYVIEYEIANKDFWSPPTAPLSIMKRYIDLGKSRACVKKMAERKKYLDTRLVNTETVYFSFTKTFV